MRCILHESYQGEVSGFTSCLFHTWLLMNPCVKRMKDEEREGKEREKEERKREGNLIRERKSGGRKQEQRTKNG